MDENKLFVCKYLDKNIVVERIQTIYFEEDKSLGKHLYFDYANNNILVSYFKIDDGKEIMLKQILPKGYDLTNMKKTEIDEFHKNIIDDYQIFCEKEISFFKEHKNQKIKKLSLVSK